MKKLIPLLSLTFLIGLLSSCILALDSSKLGNNGSKPTKTRFDITCRNTTLKKITDWCVRYYDDTEDEYDSIGNYEDKNCEIESGRSDTIYDLPKDYYSVCFSFAEKNQLQPEDYIISNEIFLDEDVTFDVAERCFYRRAANPTEPDIEEVEYVLICSNGQEYPLVKADSGK